MHNYNKLVKNIRKKSFPEIKGRIWIVKVPFFIPGSGVLWLFPRVSLLVIASPCDRLSKKIITGLMSHELSHFSLAQRKKWIYFYPHLIRYIFSSKCRIEEERMTDTLAVRKGYGKELIALKVKANKLANKLLKNSRWKKHFSDNYLTVEEVREYMLKVKR